MNPFSSCPINPCAVGLSHEHRQVLDDLRGESLDISMAPPGDVDASGDDADWEEVGELTGDQAMAQSIHELVAQQCVPVHIFFSAAQTSTGGKADLVTMGGLGGNAGND